MKCNFKVSEPIIYFYTNVNVYSLFSIKPSLPKSRLFVLIKKIVCYLYLWYSNLLWTNLCSPESQKRHCSVAFPFPFLWSISKKLVETRRKRKKRSVVFFEIFILFYSLMHNIHPCPNLFVRTTNFDNKEITFYWSN